MKKIRIAHVCVELLETTWRLGSGARHGIRRSRGVEWLDWRLHLLSPRKEVIQPHLPVRLPCYDLAPVTGFTLNSALRQLPSGPPSFHGLTGGVYKVRERIHRIIADIRLLAIPASWSRVADSNLN